MMLCFQDLTVLDLFAGKRAISRGFSWRLIFLFELIIQKLVIELAS